MRVCPHCGYYNPDSSTTCIDCKQPLIRQGNTSAPRQWRVCPDCGYRNVEEAETCLRCGYGLIEPVDMPEDVAEPAAPLQLPVGQAPDTRRKGPQYVIGLGAGLIPLIVCIIGLGLALQTGPQASADRNTGNALLNASLALYGASLLATIICLFIREVRFAGYGLLTMVFVSPVVAFIACTVIVSSTLSGVH